MKQKVIRLNEDSKKGMTSQVAIQRNRDNLNELELQVSQIIELRNDSDMLATELRDHVIDLYQRGVLALLKSHSKFNEKLS